MNYKAFYTELQKRLTQSSSVWISTNLQTGEKIFGKEKDGYNEQIGGKPHAVLCGGGHIALALLPILKLIDWHVTVIDDRAEFADKNRFPNVDQVVCTGFDTLQDMNFDQNAYFVIMTRGHQNDAVCLQAILQKPHGYIGMIGSKGKVAAIFQQMREQGFSQSLLESVCAPVGLPIGGSLPGEIAVSIAAQMISVYHQTGKTFIESEIFDRIAAQSRPMVLATIIEKSGSVPRGVGARMLIFADRTIAGSVGGGALEAGVIKDALASQTPFCCKTYHLSDQNAAGLGMICGGSIKVLFEKIV